MASLKQSISRSSATRRNTPLGIPSLSAVIQPVKWVQADLPYPHAQAFDVFNPDFYRQLCDSQTEVFRMAELARGVANRGAHYNYDAAIESINESSPLPLQVFLTREWHGLLSSLYDLPYTNDINVAMHNHEIGSRDGWIHNDFNPGWFAQKDGDDINLANYALCNYKTGKLQQPGIRAKETIRSLAMIYYLNNTWHTEADGGGTGLYTSKQDPLDQPQAVIQPVNNSIFIFPCTPYSFHAFRSNKTYPRNSIVMWLHSPMEYAVNKWGREKIVLWK
jgi:hypothetical protein